MTDLTSKTVEEAFEEWEGTEETYRWNMIRAEYLYVPDYLICGDAVSGTYQLHGMDFWRAR